MSLPFGSFGRCLVRNAPLRRAATLVLLLSLASAMLAQKLEERENESKDDPRARAEYLEQKRNGGAPVPAGARQHALKEVDGMLEREGKAYWQKSANATADTSGATPEASVALPSSTSITPSASQWTPIGPQPSNTGLAYPKSSGRVTALAVDPNDNSGNTVYLGAAQGGVWKTTDGGTTWTPISDGEQSLAIGSIAIDSTTNPSTIYVGTGEENFSGDSYYGVGILKSTDCAALSCTWQPILATNFTTSIPECSSSSLSCGGPRIGAIAIQPGTGGATAVLLAAVSNHFSNSGGIYRSQNGGATWTNPLPNVTADTVAWGSSQIAYAGVHGSGVYVSSGNGGTSFAQSNGTGTVITTVPAGTSVGRIVLAVDPNDANKVYAAVEAADFTHGHSTLAGFYKSTNAGANWTKLGPGTLPKIPDYCGGAGSDQCFYDNVIAVNPANSNVIFAGGSGNPNSVNFLVRSVDGGTNWTVASNAIHADQHGMAFTSAGKLYLGNDGGVYSTTDTTSGSPAPAWINLNNGLNTIQFYGYFAIHPTDSQITFGGAQDNGTQKFTGQNLNNTLPWDLVTCGDGAGAVFDVNDPRTVFANCQNIDVRKSTSGNPFTFNNVDTGLGVVNTVTEPVAFIPPLVGDTANPLNLYFGTNHLWRSSNAGVSWNEVSTTTLTGSGSPPPTISNITISSDNNIAYTVSSDGKVYRISNLSTSPVATDVTGTGLPSGVRINALAILPSDVTGNTLYVAVAGFNAGQHVYKTTSGGGTWAGINGSGGGSLPNTPANDIVIDPDLPGTVYLATDVGVFKSTDDGANWSTLQTGMPKVAVFGLKLHRPSRTLRAATHGRGMWDLSVPACTSGPCGTLSASSLNFGNQNVGTSSDPQTITLTSNGDQALIINSISSSNPSEFAISGDTCPGSLAVSATCTMSITFTPTSAFSRSGTMNVVTNSVNSPITAALSGTGISGPRITLSPTSLNFDPQVVGTTSAAQTINLTNSGNQTLNITSVSVGGEFGQTNNCGSVAVGTTCTISVTFLPRAAFGRTGGITILSNAANKQAGLSGTGVVIPANDDYANAATITSLPYTSNVITNGATSQATDPAPAIPSCAGTDFDVTPGFNHHAVWYFYTPATSGTVNMDTIGSDYDTVLSVWTGSPGSFAAVFGGCNDDINPGVARQSTIQGMNVTGGTTYRILVSGYYATDSGSLVFHMTAGPATSVALSPTALSFSGLIGRSSAAQSVTVTNNSGGPLTISNVSVSGDYSQSNNCVAGAIANGSSCTVNVIFAPTMTGQRNGVLTLTDGASGSPRTIPITGSGFDFGISLKRISRPSRSGGGAVVSGQSKSFDLELTSSGTSEEVVSLECVGAPRGTTCSVEPAQVGSGSASIPIQVHFQTTAGPASSAGNTRRAKRLSGGGTPAGSYQLQVNARVGDVVRSTLITATVEAATRAVRLR